VDAQVVTSIWARSAHSTPWQGKFHALPREKKSVFHALLKLSD
jgi:hypothetical protein